jgi:hypothetical protein
VPSTSRPRPDGARLLALAALLVSALLLSAGCGDAGHTADTGEAPATTDTTAPPDPWRTEVATAVVPEVAVHLTDPRATAPGAPGSADTTGPTATDASWSSSRAAAGTLVAGPSVATATPVAASAGGDHLGAIPRVGYATAGVRRTPEGFTYENPTYFGNPLVFVVTQDDGGDWLRVKVLARPNNQEGWVLRSDVALSEVRTHVELVLSTFHLKAWDGDRLIAETDVVVGKDSTPTPIGSSFVTEKIPRPVSGAYGPWILATSHYSEALDDFDGGLPQVAFHGTNTPALIGTKASNGCVRMPNDVDQMLADQLPAGTPITVTP